MVSEMICWLKRTTFKIVSGHFPVIFRTFSKTFLVTKRVAVGAVELYRGGFCRKFQAGADFEVKSAVASYFWYVFKTLLGHFLVHFCVFFFAVWGRALVLLIFQRTNISWEKHMRPLRDQVKKRFHITYLSFFKWKFLVCYLTPRKKQKNDQNVDPKK